MRPRWLQRRRLQRRRRGRGPRVDARIEQMTRKSLSRAYEVSCRVRARAARPASPHVLATRLHPKDAASSCARENWVPRSRPRGSAGLHGPGAGLGVRAVGSTFGVERAKLHKGIGPPPAMRTGRDEDHKNSYFWGIAWYGRCGVCEIPERQSRVTWLSRRAPRWIVDPTVHVRPASARVIRARIWAWRFAT
jgi:hypothetical protein